MPDRVLRAQESAGDIDRHESVPLLHAGLVQRRDHVDARAVEQDVQAVELLDRPGLPRRPTACSSVTSSGRARPVRPRPRPVRRSQRGPGCRHRWRGCRHRPWPAGPRSRGRCQRPRWSPRRSPSRLRRRLLLYADDPASGSLRDRVSVHFRRTVVDPERPQLTCNAGHRQISRDAEPSTHLLRPVRDSA